MKNFGQENLLMNQRNFMSRKNSAVHRNRKYQTISPKHIVSIAQSLDFD